MNRKEYPISMPWFRAYSSPKEFCLVVERIGTLSSDNLDEFFDYIDTIKAEYHNFLKDKEQGF